MNCVHLSTPHARWASQRLASLGCIPRRAWQQLSCDGDEAHSSQIRASGQARHALRRAHIKAAAGDANATTNAMAQAAEQQTRRCQFAAHGMRGEARLIFPAIALKLPWGRPHVVLDLMDISSHEPHRWLAVWRTMWLRKVLVVRKSCKKLPG